MSEPWLIDGIQPAAVLLAALLAVLTVAVIAALARRARAPQGMLAAAWCMGGAVSVGVAVWVTWWTGAAAVGVPWASAPGLLPAALSGTAAVAMSALAVALASRAATPLPALTLAAGSVALTLTVVHGVAQALQGLDAGPGGLAWVAVAAAVLLLAPAYATAHLDQRLQARASLLSRSLRDANADLQRAVLHDPLTSLPNRRLLTERLQQAGTRCDANGTQAALLFIDLDGFKPLNDLFGHGFGDTVLCEVAHRLKGVVRDADTVARLAGDEFVVLLSDLPDPGAATQLAARVLAALQAPMLLGQREARISASLGIATYPADGAPGKLLAAADAAMAEAKRGGGGRAVCFASHMEAAARAQIELQRDLRLAMDHPERRELHLHYQPKVSARDGRITGVEALLRWRHPVRGMVGPAEFIPVAERFGLIDRLGAWVIDEACQQIQAWQQQGLRLRVAVNLSMHQLRQPGLVDRVRQTLAQHGLSPARLMFEITESAAMTENDFTGNAFDDLASLGTELSIDDFGTGYSSLAWLRRLPARQIKIDRSFVMDLDTCSDALAIVQAVIRLAHALGLAVVAEGVETAAQMEMLRQLQCDEFQGYLFSRPVAGEVLLAWARGIDRPAQLNFDMALSEPAPAPAPAPGAGTARTDLLAAPA